MSHRRARGSTLIPVVAALATVAWLLPSLSEASISTFYTATGAVTVSADGHGSNTNPYNLRASKPSATATVRNAFLMAVTTGETNATLAPGNINFAATPITFTTTVPSSINSNNYLTEVTSIVKPTLDAAAVGITNFAVTESSTFNVDGTALVVVWDDPSLVGTRTVALLFGAQNTGGDTFSITLASPIDPVAPGALFDMGLGISYGFQGSGQDSQVNVNGTRLTSSAGGQDDGEPANGALITVGGIGDSNANPANPNAVSNGDPRIDDELYNILPFITNSTTNISVFTLNPSGDDNIFFAYFNLSGSATVVAGPTPTPGPTSTPTPPPSTPAIVPTLGGGGMGLLAILLAGLGIFLITGTLKK